MTRLLESLGIEVVNGKRVFGCLKCGYVLGLATKDYKTYALKYDASISKGQPSYLAGKGGLFILREYYCPKCATMFEVDMVLKEEEQVHSIELKE